MTDSPVSNDTVRHINPYDQALIYRNNFWLGPLPLPYKKKDPPPTGSTGHNAKYPSVEEINDWQNAGRRNICLRLAGVDDHYEIIGIDVDHYQKGDKDKRGGDQLDELEIRLGDLPETWISSSRTDGVSGIRYYRVPRGFAYRGQVDKDIECISKGYRYAIVWPSIHDELGSTYWWFPPGTVPSKEGKKVWDGTLPLARTLPELPQEWHKYLTQGGMRATHQRIDMDSSLDEVYVWADNTFHEGDICPLMREKIDKHAKKIAEEATSHDKITNFHWNIVNLAAEGHLGWNDAVNELEQLFFDEMVKRNKRGDEIHGEIFRSRIQALRKIKGDCDERIKIGAEAIDARCDRMGGLCSTSAPQADPSDPLSVIPTGASLGLTGNYEMNDDGNAQHFVDYFSSAEHGPSVRWADGRGWLVWHEGDNPHWETDVSGDQTIRRMWQKVKERQLQYVEALHADYEMQVKQWNLNGPMPDNVKAAKAAWQKWMRFAELSGNNRNAQNAIEAVKSIPGVSIDVNKLDSNSYLLGVANGIVELTDHVKLRKAKPSDYVTFNTRIPYEHPTDLAKAEWQKYLDTFVPNRDLQRSAQVALGHCIVGGNPEKTMIVLKGEPNTGKSTMVSAIETAMGDYSQTVNLSIFQNHKLNPVLADAIPARVIFCSELEEKDSLSVAMIKRLTGNDIVRAEKKGSNAKFEGLPQFVPLLATNAVPTISGVDKALQNRLFVIPFNVTPKHLDKKFANVIKAICGPAILEWLIDGYIEYRRINELPMHHLIRQETENFVAELDEVATFVNQCLERSSVQTDVIRHDAMNTLFKRWWQDNDYQQRDFPSKNLLTRRLTALGLQKKMARVGDDSARYWLNLKVKKTAPQVVSLTNFKMHAVSDSND